MVWKKINGLDRVSDGQECHWGARGVPPVKHLHTILTSVALSFHRVCDKDSDKRRNLWSTVFVPMVLSRAGVSCFYHLVRVGDVTRNVPLASGTCRATSQTLAHLDGLGDHLLSS